MIDPTRNSARPRGRKAPVKSIQTRIDRVAAAARGVFPRTCPICGHQGMFTMFGHPPRYDAGCPKCGSLERHRLTALYLQRHPDLFQPQHRVLHFAPERQLAGLIRDKVGSYETADLSPRLTTTHQVNIEDTGLPSDHYDRIVCNHVLEHVDDSKALAEMFRILRPGGIALLMTPVIEGWAKTYENPAVTDPRGRLLHFGQNDHVRMYGRDIRDRIRAPGFLLAEFVAEEPDVAAHGLIRGETLFIATKPQ